MDKQEKDGTSNYSETCKLYTPTHWAFSKEKVYTLIH
jgi:hypothetical protein